MLNNKAILITGGTGSFGHHFVDYVLKHYQPAKIIIYSRDEYKQFVMNNEYGRYKDMLRFFIGTSVMKTGCRWRCGVLTMSSMRRR